MFFIALIFLVCGVMLGMMLSTWMHEQHEARIPTGDLPGESQPAEPSLDDHLSSLLGNQLMLDFSEFGAAWRAEHPKLTETWAIPRQRDGE